MRRRASGLALLAGVVLACNDGTGPAAPDAATQPLVLRRDRDVISPAFAADSGAPAMFINGASAPVFLLGFGCGGHLAGFERWEAGHWVSLAGPPNPCLMPNSGLSVNDSVRVSGTPGNVSPGTYRLRLPTSAGDAVSHLFLVR